MYTIGIREFRMKIKEVLTKGFPIALEKYGKVIAYLVSPHDFKKLEEAKEEKWRKKFDPPESVVVEEDTPF